MERDHDRIRTQQSQPPEDPIKIHVECRTTAEFEACIKAGNIAVIFGLRVVAPPGSTVVARGSSHVEAWGSSHVEAWESSHVVARGSSHVEAWGSSHVEAWESSHVEAWGSSHVEAWESSHVEAWGNVFVRLFAAAAIIASAHVVVMCHGTAIKLEGGIHIQAMKPVIGSEWCEYFGLNPATSNLRLPNIDATILASIEANKAAGTNGLNMSSWHGDEEKANEAEWCNTTHCRAGYAICLVGKAGFDLEKKVGSEVAGQMIYAVSRLDKPLPDFMASNEAAMEDIRANAAEQMASGLPGVAE